MSPRIAFDGFWWNEGPPSGQNVLHSIVGTWARITDDEIHVLVRESSNGMAIPVPGETHTVSASRHPIANRFESPKLLRKISPHATLSQNFGIPVSNSATFFHDAIFKDHPEWFSVAERLYLSLALRSVRRTSILTSSATEAARISRITGQRVVPVGLAANQGLMSATPTRPGWAADLESFSLTVGRLNVRKNLSLVVDAHVEGGFATPSSPLIVVGESDGLGEKLSGPARAAMADRSVRFVGFVPEAELAWLYSECLWSTSLSLDEGFGMPPVEGRMFGRPVLASDIPVFRENLAEDPQTFFVDPVSKASVLSGLARLREHVSADHRDEFTPPHSWETVVEGIRAALLGGAP